MKLQLESGGNQNIVTAYGDGFVTVNETRHVTSLVLMPEKLLTDWAQGGFDALLAADFERLRELEPELVLFGTGRRQRFPQPALLKPLIDSRIGFEIMDTAAACRTYNILVSEGRLAAAALLLE